MLPYHVVDAPNRRRPFCLTFGLQQGYGGEQHPLEDLREAILAWMRRRGDAGLPYVTGVLAPCQALYAWKPEGAPAQSRAENSAQFSGEVSPLFLADLTDEEVKNMLCDLGASAGSVLGQHRVYVAYLDQAWVLQQS